MQRIKTQDRTEFTGSRRGRDVVFDTILAASVLAVAAALIWGGGWLADKAPLIIAPLALAALFMLFAVMLWEARS